MYSNKGSGISPRRWRWAALALIFICLVLFNKFPLQIIPAPPLFLHSQSSCPAHPPSPPFKLPPGGRFNWRDVSTQYPVQSFAQLPTSRLSSSLPPVQHDFNEAPSLYAELIRKQRQAAVKGAFQRSWTSYKERAWLKDELKPISGGSKTTFGGWGATLVDSLDTLWIMDMKEDFEDAIAALTHINFKPDGVVNMFETTIRYLGGLLAAYDLTDCKDRRLLAKAMELGDMIYAGFDTPNRMPVTRWDSMKASRGEEQSAALNGIIAEMASFSLEFTRLSQLTGDMRYYDAVSRVANVLEEQQSRTKLPGLWPVGIDVQTPDFTRDNQFSLGAMADSAYEYLGKTYQLLRGVGSASQYKKMYELAMNAVIQHLLFRPMVPDEADILMPTSVRANGPSDVVQDHVAQHLVCFVGGMLALGGRLFQNTTHVEIGRKVTDACIWTYQNAPLGIMPEMFTMPACPSHEKCTFDPKKGGDPPGFRFISDARYILRPEAIESVFYMYRITGDDTYQDIAWEMFQAIDSQTRTQYANAALKDVMKENPERADSMDSFWTAETLKYFYLIFSEPGFISLDQWVFNTEAHPFRLVV
ncbi:glycoside hydrolase family 47 protein [Zopfia rhizophila CBS 207.26]|uniref:alpha-1,2-Mannosidase n=1 Tax=Zopfia rhizophila CBS 207.26 TaxID=1314779 RepID=A0A6A6DFV3_9PEZI|nr:glycoside hydrolase family 47 protein [Zopfia rhizophila CBS 207.26]